MIVKVIVLAAILSSSIEAKKCKPKTNKQSVVSTYCDSNSPLLDCSMKTNNNNALQCKMTIQPSNSTIFALSSNQKDLTMNVRQLTFTSQNWDKVQSITMNPIYDSPQFKNSTSISLTYSAIGLGEKFDGCSGTYIGQRSVDTFKSAGVCNMWGDPHVTTFSDSNRSPILLIRESINVPIHHLGVHYAVKSNLGLTIQTKYGKCIHVSDDEFQASCVIGVYVEYKKQFISINLPNNLQNGEPVVKTSNSTDTMKIDIAKKNIFKISVKDGADGDYASYVKVTANTFDITYANGGAGVRAYYFDAEIKLSPVHYQQVQGHCNVYDFSDQVYDPRHHLLFAGDKVWTANISDSDKNALSIMEWTLAFQVPSNENGFESGRLSKRSDDDNSESTHDSTNTTSSSSSNSSNMVFVKLQTNMTIEVAMLLCKACVGLDDTDLELISQSGMMSCVSDAMMTGSNLFCASHSRIITTNLIAASQSNNTLSIQSANSLTAFVQKLAGIDCGVNGLKSDGVCHCNQGFSGIDCSIRVHSSMLMQNDGTMVTSSSVFTNSASLMLLAIVLMMQL